jgi:hypothetical protein
MKNQIVRNLLTYAREWAKLNLKKAAIAVFVLGFFAGAVIAAEPAVTLTYQVGEDNAVTLNWSAPWATSCTASGGWSGSKAATGTQTLPAITATTTYGLSCSATVAGDTVAVLDWTPPTQYTDGSALPASDLAAFRIYQGTSAGSLSRVAEVPGSARSTSRSGLAAGTHYFAVTAVTRNGAESGLSAVGSKVATSGGTISDSESVTVRVARPPTLTVQETTAYDVRLRGIRFVLNREIGTVPVGTPCHKDFELPGGYYRVEREAVSLTERSSSAVFVAKCG